MESSNPKFALYGWENEYARTNMLILPLSEVITGAVSLHALLQQLIQTTELVWKFLSTMLNRNQPVG